MANTKPYITQEGDTVDLIAHTQIGRTAEVTETIFALNPGLADLPPTLPAGVAVLVPLDVKAQVKPSKRLWS